MSNPFRCWTCGKTFRTKVAVSQHAAAKHGRGVRPDGKEGAMAVLDMITDDETSDESFWAHAFDLGLEPDDFIKEE